MAIEKSLPKAPTNVLYVVISLMQRLLKEKEEKESITQSFGVVFGVAEEL